MSAAVLAAAIALTPAQTMPAEPPAAVAAPSADSQIGLRSSAYTGRKYRPADEQYRRCVAQREGRHQYGVTGSNGMYQGTYQMTAALVRGAAWEMRDELIDTWGKAGRKTFRVLLVTPGHRWSRFYQDMAFWTILNARGERSGAKHWAGGRFTYTPGMAAWGGAR